MKRITRIAGRFGLAAAGFGVLFAAQAQSVDNVTQRNVDQQQRIEQGLQSGQLTTREAAKLEQGEAHIDRIEQRDLRDGTLSAQDQAQIRHAQNRESAAIYSQKHDAQTGNPDSRSSQRMQADVQRNIDQQQRIRNGVASGSLTNREAAHLEGREAHVDHLEARAGADGRVGAREQARIQRTDNRDSRRIYRQKHDRQHR
ncbi:hypothetical protein MBSD_n0649 [Mizugakiibacter sediminis]|uniref:Phage infection protein n=1 Tax=Mizugakiibacter sediminis TaxID=1475481 RepID=A0A0K8QK88_9GAMM|nr:hypothetical protein [Mizugakiibacter sediminis]GAP65360.1 hypothetical protein MBSD_n0649 [Mizugakiibacter sediminis]